MADFQAVVGNIVVTPTLITIDDTSDYAGSTQDGHLSAEFSDYKKLIIQTPVRTFSYSTEGDGNVLTTAGTGSITFNVSLTSDDIDGIYDVTLYTVPTYNAINTTYDKHECVYYNGILYKSNVNGNSGNTPDISTEWTSIISDLLTFKYCVTDSIAITDRVLMQCYEALLHEASCILESNLCSNMCDSLVLQKAMKLRLVIDMICKAVGNNDFVAAKKLFNLAHQLCKC